MNKLRSFFSVRSKLMLLLIGVGALAGIVLLYIGYNSGQEAIRKSVFDKLTAVRISKKYQVETYFKELFDVTEVMGQTEDVRTALEAFTREFNRLDSIMELGFSCNEIIDDYHEFGQKISKNLSVVEQADYYLPERPAACLLQNKYVFNNEVPAALENQLDTYERLHRQYHPQFKELIEKIGFEDIFLVDIKSGNIVYNVLKEPDFATNLYDGIYRTSNLANLVRQLQSNSDLTEAEFIDFKFYRPSLGVPAAFIGVPVNRGSANLGALVFQVSIREINQIMSDNGKWSEATYGQSGESIIVGDDFLTRTDPRVFTQDTARFTSMLSKVGVSESNAQRMYQLGTTVLSHKTRSPAVEDGLAGNTGTHFVRDFRQRNILSAYTPLSIKGVNWVLLAETNESEANELIRDFRRRMLTALFILLIAISFLAMFLAGLFVRPIEQLSAGVERLRSGDYAHPLAVTSTDEFGRLSGSFNDLAQEIKEQRATIIEKNKETARILNNFIPEKIVSRLQSGEKDIVEIYQSTTIISMRFVEFDQIASSLPPDEVLKLLNTLLRQIMDLVIKHQVRKIRTVGDTYLAVCGMFTPRLDATRRLFDFAVDVRLLAARFGAQHNMHLNMQFLIHFGDISAGIVGNEQYSFDLWGKTYNELLKLRESVANNKIVVTQPVYERLKDYFKFQQHSPVTQIEDMPELYEYIDMVVNQTDQMPPADTVKNDTIQIIQPGSRE